LKEIPYKSNNLTYSFVFHKNLAIFGLASSFMHMVKWIFIIVLFFGYLRDSNAQVQETDRICSQRYHYCFSIPPNFFMLTKNDVESASVSYKTVDGTSTIDIINGSLPASGDFHSLYLMVLGQYSSLDYRITMKKEFTDYFIVSGYTQQGRGFYQKVIRIHNDYASAYLEFPKGNRRFSNVSQMLFDTFEKTILN
jgi:hypothetical protein